MMSKKVLFLFLCILPLFFGCRTNTASQRQHQVETQKEENDRQAKKMYEEGKAKHLNNQTKETRSRMKLNKEKSEKASYYKKECFIKRWFKRKPKSCIPA